ncbi:U32 family peptidase [Rubritalea marina]|uniref:U32 family peptidase n=1 Tax=Rubritalea marina TaxID=361055 RepID=UPI00036E6E7F|nr:U32 family peptidase [Rubritalea marina]
MEIDRTPELLSPAGNWDCARAAVANGADAIFFGLSKFNARLRADNFTDADLPELMDFLHAHGVKGFVTMNTLIFTEELAAAEEQLRLLERCGVDAIIVQDLGLAKLCRRVAPSVEIHASTQMTITSPEGLEFIDSIYKLERAVLSRELSLTEINKFKPSECVPLEVFVHGALCVAYSGQCLTSESLGQRSANRGECAQACRMPYELVVDGETVDMGEKRYLLSPQDLAAVDLIPDLVKQGVVSYKIEGRLKTPEYVAAVTRVYRKAIDDAVAERASTITDRDRYAMEMTFSRGLTTGWLAGTNHPYLTHGKFGKKRGVRVGTVENCGSGWIIFNQEGEHGLKAGDGIVFDAGENRNLEQGSRIWAVEGNTLKFHVKHCGINWDRIKPGIVIYKTDDPKLNSEVKALWKNAKLEPLRDGLHITVTGTLDSPLTLSCNGISVSSSEKLEAAQNRPLSTETLAKQLGRLGQTAYELGSVDNQLEGELILPVSALNRLRRALVEKLDVAAAAATPAEKPVASGTLADIMPATPSEPIERAAELSVLTRHPHQIEAALEAGINRIYADFEDIRRYKEAVEIVRAAGGNASIHLATPRIQKPNETGYFKFIDRSEPDGVLIRNLGAVNYFAERDGLYRTGDFSLNCANPATAKILKEHAAFDHLTLSYDLNIQQLLDMLRKAPSDWFELTLHQHMPMFHMEHCVYCTFMSEGTSYKDCGRPCEKHQVQLRDRVGQLHTLMADVGCRNTLFNGRAQTGARFYDEVRATGLSRYRIDFLNEDKVATLLTLQAYQQLVDKRTDGHLLWQDLGAMEKLGVTEGTLEVKA